MKAQLRSFPFSVYACISLLVACAAQSLSAQSLVTNVEWQPLAGQIERLFEALDYLGSPVSPQLKSQFEQLRQSKLAGAVEKVQALLDPLCLLQVEINPESRVKVLKGAAK